MGRINFDVGGRFKKAKIESTHDGVLDTVEFREKCKRLLDETFDSFRCNNPIYKRLMKARQNGD